MPYIVTTEQGRIAAAQRDAADSVAKIEDKIVDYCVAHDVDLGQEDRATLPERHPELWRLLCERSLAPRVSRRLLKNGYVPEIGDEPGEPIRWRHPDDIKRH